MLGGSVPIIPETTKAQWFFPVLEAWKHYVPVKSDLSDLPDKIKWLREHDEEAKEISKNA
jgi:hypothetical protein